MPLASLRVDCRPPRAGFGCEVGRARVVYSYPYRRATGMGYYKLLGLSYSKTNSIMVGHVPSWGIG